ncbi:outer membrane lipoprotein LolB [Rudaea sp.]|uniref:outer membrane lipoprotein LolB n=1 Tax=Rudaea sp. TaxID=2136325 RepID=UPI002ED4D089
MQIRSMDFPERSAMRTLRLLLSVALVSMLAACAPMRVKQNAATPEALAAQDAREAALAGKSRWTLEARIAVSGANGGSGDLTWRQDGDAYSFSVRGANGRTLRLSGDADHAVLEGVDAQAEVGRDPQTLLRERLGAEVPFAALRRWALGLRVAGDPAQMQFGEKELPAQLVQGGWTVEYLDWFDDLSPPLPKKVFATRGKDKVRLVIQSWSFD